MTDIQEIIPKTSMKTKLQETSPHPAISAGREDYAVTLYTIEREIKAVLEKVEGLKFAALAQDNGPEDLFAALAHNIKQFLTVDELARNFQVDCRTKSLYRQGEGTPEERLELARQIQEERQLLNLLSPPTPPG
jgi:hypothetical protein